MNWLLLLLGVLTNAGASVLVKVAVAGRPAQGTAMFLQWPGIYGHWAFWLALLCYGVSFALYAISVKQMPLHTVHPVFTATSIALVAIASIFYFGESPGWKATVGMSFIIFGVLLVTSRST